jgi:pimeloyl-ACP methyl ester carboxylesterase
MAPVARTLAAERGVLEPIQTATTVQGQVDELRDLLLQHADLPAIVVGYSWGAWLGILLAAQHPPLVRKLILVSSGALAQQYVAQLHRTRLSRLDPDEQAAFEAAIAALQAPEGSDKDAHLQRLGALAQVADSYDPLPAEPCEQDRVELSGDVYRGVWQEAAEMRRTGTLLALAGQLSCPVTAIHGDHDPSPAEGVRAPLSARLDRFSFVLLPRCGHTPWQERQAREAFYRVLRHELGEPKRVTQDEKGVDP